MTDRDPLQTLWSSQTQEPFSMSIADVHTRAERFQARIRQRNWTEYAAAAFVVAAFGWTAVNTPVAAIQIGAGLIMLGALYVCWRLYKLGRAATSDEMAAAQSWADFHRGELMRQREALRTVWRWYLAPFAPGMLVFLAGVAFTPENPAPFPVKLGVFLTGFGLMSAVFGAIAWLNARAADALGREIAALDQVRAS